MRLILTGLVCAAAASAGTAPSQVTFYKEVLPVLQKNCQGCHRPGESAPMSFLNYDQTRPWAKAMKQAVLTKKMPPWYADPHFGKFSNDRTLAQADVDTIVSWADSGAKAGDAKDGPKPIDFVEGWRIGKPDAVIEMPEAFNVPASGAIDYQYVIIPGNFKEDTYVQVAEARPGNPALVHHIIAFIREPDNPWMRDMKPGVLFVPKSRASDESLTPEQRKKAEQSAGGFPGDFLSGYAPGTVPFTMRPGEAKLVKAGSDIVLQLHYTANGTAGTDRSRIGIVYAKDKPEAKVLTLAAATANFAIPPGDPNYQVDAKLKLQRDVTLVTMLPHMHFRGKDFEYRVTYPSGEKETLLVVPHYDFNWQLTYELEKPKFLPKGTLIECTAHYDNSVNNKYNPDPTKTVRYGDQTWEEMMFGFFEVSVPLDVTAMDIMRPPQKQQPATTSGSGL
jgi:hypothetical protein